MQTEHVLDEGVRVVVAPSQASYFAGEPFTVTVALTNVRTPAPLPHTARSVSQSATLAHKRGAHSVSYVPMSRPPTSPGVRSAMPAAPARPANGAASVVRRGLVGKPRDAKRTEDPAEPIDPTRRRLLLGKSLSVSIGSLEFLKDGQADVKGKSPLRASYSLESPSPPSVSPSRPSPLTRSVSLPSNHPHARKQSVLDGNVQIPVPQQTPSATPNPSTSTFSLALDPIVESATSPITPATSVAPSPVLHHPTPPALNSRQPPLRKTSYPGAFLAPNTELILYSYAQLVGSVSLVPLPDTPLSPEQSRNLHNLRRGLQKAKAVGGGNMDISAGNPRSLPSPTGRRAHARSASLSSGLMSILSPTSPSGASGGGGGWTPGHRPRTTSAFSGFFGSSAADPASADESEEVETHLPTFEVPPSVLAVDLSLGPSESRTYTYTLNLPRDLPPTFRGRAIRFQYEFVIGVCRASGGGANSSRVMKVPIRIYNHVSVTRPPTPYDLCWPMFSRSNPHARPMPSISSTDLRIPLGSSTTSLASGTVSETDDLESYSRLLLSTMPKRPGADGVVGLPRTNFGFNDRVDEEQEPGCRESVELLTRNPKKSSYDVHKDGVKVAVLTFTKSAYRLGETVLGVVQCNHRASRAKVLKVSALLETYESMPACLVSVSAASPQMRRVHAEAHSAFVGSTMRTTFSLDIPPDASPAFQVVVSGAENGTASPGGLEWKVRMRFLVAVASEDARVGEDGVRLKHLVRDGPRGEWGTSWKASQALAPSERPSPLRTPNGSTIASQPTQSWTSFFSSAFLGSSEPANNFHDGDEDLEDELDEDGTEEDWREVRLEMVECEVPIKVWAGNTAFKASEVVFEV